MNSMNEFIKFSDFQKTVNVTPIKMYRTFSKLRDSEMLQQEIDWRLEGGSLYVIPSKLYFEARKLRPEIEYVNVKSDEIKNLKVKSDESKEVKEKSDKVISNDDKVKSDEFKRNHLKSNENKSEVAALLKEQIDGLKNDKKYLQDQVVVKSEEVANANKERAFLMQNWQELVRENDGLRRQLTSGKGEIKVKSNEISGQEDVPEEKIIESGVGGISEVVSHTTVPQSPQNERGEDFIPEEENSPSSMSEPHTEENFGAGEGTPPPQDYGEDGEVINITSA